MTRRTGLLLRLSVSIALLVAVATVVDTDRLLGHLHAFHPGWTALALLLMLVQHGISAWRWRFTAHRLGVDLPRGTAVREYLLAGFVNQVLPGGVLGDVSRAWRHARGSGSAAAAVYAVALERASGQAVMALLAAPALLTLGGLVPPGIAWPAAAATAAGALVAARWLPEPPGTGAGGFLPAVRQALVARAALPVQLLSSALVVATYLAVYYAAARVIGADIAGATLLPLVPVVLLAMLVPVTVAGWGLREGAAALVWAAAGLDPAQGAAIAVAYGVLVLLGNLPGALCLSPRRMRGDR
ncbi:lysylphosphatidylglycerol synthase transmembrane domain-containing protein [Aquisalimonas lutea]|uniref:lysylphosphatidylglycerol synthase transmembrane domain-containing protein n=1 Tax=Aquisalimonas lutea TaxID=1327750 RepID=UPI0025B5E58F|nr:lysylphosphatidylglycerol synthase transmembrane domain-containing protein [Aquisalimonas lutea]MDN3516211.1 lysylphosphatidylglycerol synthase transmembrane domain-containing protein [Aquisalimonas lutea]